MSAPKPLAEGRREIPLHGSIPVRVLVLMDVGDLVVENGDTARYIDGLRLSVVRVLLHLCTSCPQGSWVEWATRFFDSRHGGVGKTPTELKARLRSRQALQGTRGFTRVTQASFDAFGSACLGVACGLQGDPLGRDRDAALRRWSHSRKKQPSNRAGQASNTDTAEEWAARAAPKVDLERSRDDDARRMYDGHDMSSHEVLVRSLLEVLPEFGEAGERDRAVGPSTPAYSHDAPQLQLLLLHSTCPHTDEEVERFTVRGNFTAEAANLAVQRSEERAPALAGLLDAGLGKAVLRARSRGISFLWQDGIRTDTDGEGGICSTQPATIVHRLLSRAGRAGILSWRRVVGSTGLLPPSVMLGEWPAQQGGCWNCVNVAGADLGASQRTDGVVVCVALNGQGVIDARLVASPVSSSRNCVERSTNSKDVGLAPRGTPQAVLHGTPWRLMGTLPVSQVWPISLEGQGWGSTVVLRVEGGLGAQRWRDLLRELLAGELVASISLPSNIFSGEGGPYGGDVGRQGVTSGAATVALVMPVSRDCAVGWSVRRLESTRRGGREAFEAEHVGAQMQLPEPTAMGCGPSAEEGDNVVSQPMPGVSGVGKDPTRTDMLLKMRQAEVGLAMHDATLARRGRRRAKAVPLGKARGTNSVNSSIAGAGYRATVSGGHSASLSPRDSLSLSFTGEGTSGDGVGFNMRQWRLEMASEASNGSGSTPRGLRLFDAAGRTAEYDEQASSTGSSSGPRRALHQALEDASSRSSLLGPDADFSSTPGSKEGAGGGAVRAPHVNEIMGRESRAQRGNLFSTSDDASAPADLSGVDKVGAGELPLSMLCEPRLACLPGAPLPAELISCAERCVRDNQAAAAAATASGASRQAGLVKTGRKTSGSHRVGARRRFIDAVRSLENRKQEEGKSVVATPSAPVSKALGNPAHESDSKRKEAGDDAAMETLARGGSTTQAKEQVCSAPGDGGDVLREALGFDDSVSKAVTGLLKQYREVVEGGQRSPVDFVVRTVPEAIRDLTDKGASGTGDSCGVADPNSRAAQVLAAVVSGLTSTPEELSAKHRVNRSARPVQAGATNTSKPAMQKVRDYQLQALLLCQLHVLAMDLPETPESITAFAALATSGIGQANAEARSRKGRKGKGKGKGKKRRRKDSDAYEERAPVRPSDPLPDYRRTRLVDYLQPISTMLDACTVTGGAPPSDSGGAGGAGAVNGFHSRPYDGTLSDFLGLCLVAHFAPRLPRTLAALFEDFERHPPDALAAALGETPGSDHQGPSRGAGGLAEAAGPESCREGTAVIDSASGAVKEPAREGNVAAADGAISRSTSTAGILLSDRTPMSHNHFKMSGVLNGFREVKLKADVRMDGLHPRVLGGVSGNDQSGHDASRGKGEGEHGAWRTRGSGGGGRDSRSRVTRDSKPAAAPSKCRPAAVSTTAPTTGTRHSPRLVRKRPDGGIKQTNGVSTAHTSVSGNKRESSSVEPAAAAQSRKRRQVTAGANPSKIGAGCSTSSGRRAGVLVVETPQKKPGNGVVRTRLRSDGAICNPQNCQTTVDASPTGAPANADSALLSTRGHIPDSPNASMGSPSRGAAAARRKGTESSDPEAGATSRIRVMPSPPSWRGTSAPNRLFVAESPGDVIGARTARSMWAGGDFGGGGDGVSRQLVTESASASPLSRECVAVPDTPA